MIDEPGPDRTKYYAAHRRRRFMKKIIYGTTPLRMFSREGGHPLKPCDLERNIKIANWLHLWDLQQEWGRECQRH